MDIHTAPIIKKVNMPKNIALFSPIFGVKYSITSIYGSHAISALAIVDFMLAVATSEPTDFPIK